ncbi:hypothetical protein [Streptomyces decoyicus]
MNPTAGAAREGKPAQVREARPGVTGRRRGPPVGATEAALS